MSADDLPSERPGDPNLANFFAPSPLYVTGEDNLRVTAYSNTAGVTLAIVGRGLRTNGDPTPIADSIAPGSGRTAVTKIIGLSEGWLLGIAVAPAAGITALGATWVQIDLVRGTGANAQLVQTLGYGFVSLRSGFGWPGSASLVSTDGPGVLRSIAGTTPGAGVEISETVPAGARWELLSLRAVLTTAVAVANRVVTVTLDDGTTVYGQYPTGLSEPASSAYSYNYGQGLARFADVSPTALVGGLPINIRLGAGHRIRTATANLQAADQWGSLQYLVREWLEGL